MESCEHSNEPSGYIKMSGIFWVAEQLLTSQGLSSMKLILIYIYIMEGENYEQNFQQRGKIVWKEEW
jgi:hypothetical protein